MVPVYCESKVHGNYYLKNNQIPGVKRYVTTTSLELELPGYRSIISYI